MLDPKDKGMLRPGILEDMLDNHDYDNKAGVTPKTVVKEDMIKGPPPPDPNADN